MLILPVLPPTIVPPFVTDRAVPDGAPTPSLPVALTVKLPVPVALMVEVAPVPSTETYLPFTLKSPMPPAFWITPPALTVTVPLVAVTVLPPVSMAFGPVNVTLFAAVVVPEDNELLVFTLRLPPAVVVAVDAMP